MQPLFTVHAGEYLVGSYIERHITGAKVWVPSRDTGVDLLVTDRKNRRTVSLQVKFSKDYLPTHLKAEFQKPLRVCGWCVINRDKLRVSQADFWVFALLGFRSDSPDFVIVPTAELRKRMRLIHGSGAKKIQSYFWVTERKKCWETRALENGIRDQRQIANGHYRNPVRDFSLWLNDWKPVVARLAK